MGAERQRPDPAYARLRSTRPAAVSAILADGEARELKLGGGKGKWDKVLATARALGAEGLELLDEGGAVIEVVPLVERERGRSTDRDELAPESTELERVLSLCGDFTERMTGRQQELLSSVCDMAIQVTRAAADRAERSERALEKVLRAHERALMLRAEEGDTSGSDALVAQVMAAMAGIPPQLTAGANGSADDGEMVLVPKAIVEKVQAYLAREGKG